MKFAWCSFALALALAGCGGGGGGGESSGSLSAPSNASAEGVYEGTTSAGQNFIALILENSELWALYGTDIEGTFLIDGFVQGSGSSNNGSYATTNGKDFGVYPAVSGALNGTYVAGISISGTLTRDGTSRTFAGAAIDPTDFNYNTPALIADVSGNWSMTDWDGNPVAIAIANNGNLTGSSGGCSFTGSITPRPSGKNVFNVTVLFGGSPCVLAGQTVYGVAVSSLVEGGPTRQLVVMSTDQARTLGTVLFGSR